MNRSLKHCYATMHKDARKYDDWTITGLPTNYGADYICVELLEVTDAPCPRTVEMICEFINDEMFGWSAYDIADEIKSRFGKHIDQNGGVKE